MTSHVLNLSFILLLNFTFYGQRIQEKLQFEQGKTLAIQMDVKASVTQQAMGQAIDFTADGTALHSYTVTGISDSSTVLHHETKKITFNFDGMGQKRSFDSGNKKDMEGQFGEPIKNILNKNFDLTIDPHGKVLMTKPEKIEPVKTDERLAIVLNMLRDITDVAYPPEKGEGSFFNVLPDNETELGKSWSDSLQNETGKFISVYTLSGITDSTIIVDIKGNAAIVSKALMMGRETTTTLNSISTGKIILDKATRIVKEKMLTTESNGTMEALGGTTPVTSKTTIVIHVKPE